jgi:hypothetical protein
MKTSLRIVSWAALAVLLAGCFPPVDDDGYWDTDDYECDVAPDLVVEEFTFTDADQGGTSLSFDDILLCNYGGTTADAGYEVAVLLSQSPDLEGASYLLYESPEMVGVAPWDCVSFAPEMSVGPGVPEGYYYVIVYADYLDDALECYEDNNWSRSDDAIYIVPGGGGADAGAE